MSVRTAESAQLGLLEEATRELAAWKVRASRRARRLTVRVFPGGAVEIVVPQGTGPRAVEQFVTRYRTWIERKVAHYRPLETATGTGLPEVLRFQASGNCWRVEYVEARGAPRLLVDGDRLLLVGDQSRVATLSHALQRFTMRVAHSILAPRLGVSCCRIRAAATRASRSGASARAGVAARAAEPSA